MIGLIKINNIEKDFIIKTIITSTALAAVLMSGSAIASSNFSGATNFSVGPYGDTTNLEQLSHRNSGSDFSALADGSFYGASNFSVGPYGDTTNLEQLSHHNSGSDFSALAEGSFYGASNFSVGPYGDTSNQELR